MSDIIQLNQLLVVTQAIYDHQRQAFSEILIQEQKLREELARLSQMNQTTEQQADHLQHMRAIGADLLWQGWLSRTKTALNIKLARILAIKEHEQDKVRQAFGKVVALEELIKGEVQRNRKKSAKSALSLSVEMSLR
jgi:hypothetical protein